MDLRRPGASCALVSRSGVLSSDAAAEWNVVQSTATRTSLERCDAAESTHVHRLIVCMPTRHGMWHAAGVSADSVLPKQAAASLVLVYAPKAHGAWHLQRATASWPLGAFCAFSSLVVVLGGH